MNEKRYYKIGEVSKITDLSVDTLRYYEKYGLLTKVGRNDAGVRSYDEHNISTLRFIKRAQRMNFTLAEIKDLLHMRRDPQHARHEVRRLTQQKLEVIENHLEELATLKNELTLLLNLCHSSENGCPIIDEIDSEDSESDNNK